MHDNEIKVVTWKDNLGCKSLKLTRYLWPVSISTLLDQCYCVHFTLQASTRSCHCHELFIYLSLALKVYTPKVNRRSARFTRLYSVCTPLLN
jgi:hypothetical protein